MYLSIVERGENGPWSCNVLAIERAADHVGAVPFGVWQRGNEEEHTLYFGTKPHWSLNPQLLTPYEAIRDAVWHEFGDFGYAELCFFFGYTLSPLTGQERYLWSIEYEAHIAKLHIDYGDAIYIPRVIRVKI